MTVDYKKLAEPSVQVAEAVTRWNNDPEILHFIRPSKNQDEFGKKKIVTVDDLAERMRRQTIYLVYLDDQLIGELGFEVDPELLHKKEKGTAWLGIALGEAAARGRGIGGAAIRYLEDQIRIAGCRRIELGVFEFNARAIGLYRKMGYVEIGRIPAFTWWQGKMWQDIRMEKYL